MDTFSTSHMYMSPEFNHSKYIIEKQVSNGDDASSRIYLQLDILRMLMFSVTD